MIYRGGQPKRAKPTSGCARARVRAALVALLTCALALAGCATFGSPSPRQSPTLATPNSAAYATDTPNVTTAACPAWTTPVAPPTITPPSDTSPAALAAYNAARVLKTPRPIRNLYTITQYLTKHLTQAIPCRTRATPRNDAIGQSATFYVVNPSQSGYHQISAKLVYVTPHLYMYVEQGANLNLDALKAAADRFEHATLAHDNQYFGQQWSPGPDDDQHITVLHALDLGPIGGYFSSEDEFPRAVSPFSNERQMIYINLGGGVSPGQEFYDATLAHEFQHMIHWYWHPADDSWTNEGMSVLAQHLNGFTSGGVDQQFLQHPDTMLGGWTDDQQADVTHYGAAYLFMDYLAEHYGGATTLRDLLTDPEQVPLNFDHVLASHGYSDTFNDVFAKFVVANLLNNPTIGAGIYAYPSIPNQHAQLQHLVTSYPFVAGSADQPATTHQYAAQYYDFQPSGSANSTLTLRFAGAPYVALTPNTPYGAASAEWWSNSANDMDSTLTHAFDLTSLAGKPATLNFAAWYNLEPDFDYAYVAVSTDGANWTTLRATTSVETNPNGGNVGHGMTGVSGGGGSPQWIPETVDLSAYAGKHIQLRFETITDDAVHYDGLTVDSITIPQLGFSDDVSTDNGWQSNGWIRSNNTLPQRYILQALLYTATSVTVQPIAVDAATGAASFTQNNLGGSITHVTLVISALAPATTVPATYTLSALVS